MGKHKITCLYCEKTFISRTRGRLLCSAQCHYYFYKLKSNKHPLETELYAYAYAYAYAYELLEKAGVGVAPGVDFGQVGKRAVRFSYASSEENILDAARRLREYLGRGADEARLIRECLSSRPPRLMTRTVEKAFPFPTMASVTEGGQAMTRRPSSEPAGLLFLHFHGASVVAAGAILTFLTIGCATTPPTQTGGADTPRPLEATAEDGGRQ